MRNAANEEIRKWCPVTSLETVKRWVMQVVCQDGNDNPESHLSVTWIRHRISESCSDWKSTLQAVDLACRALVADGKLYTSIDKVGGENYYGLAEPEAPDLGEELINLAKDSYEFGQAVLKLLAFYPAGLALEELYTALTERSDAIPDRQLFALSRRRLIFELSALLQTDTIETGISEHNKRQTFRPKEPDPN